MAAKPVTTEAIALTEKKMDMTLDDIIKMSKPTSNKSKQQQRRAPNKNQKNVGNPSKERALRVRKYMDSRSSLRQGALAQRRTNFQGNGFPFAVDAARRAAVAPFRVRASNGRRVANLNKPRVGAPPVQRRAVNGDFEAEPLKQMQQQQQQQEQGNMVTKQRPQTLDSLFANMKEQRMKVFSHQANAVPRNNGGGRQRMHRGRGRFGN